MAEIKSNRRIKKTAPSKNTEVQKTILEEKEEPSFYKCLVCGKHYKRLDRNFPASQSELYAGWNYHLPVCRTCIDNLFVHYTRVYGGDEDLAIRRICSMYDIYYNVSLLNSSRKIDKSRSRMQGYIKNANLSQYKGKTYDTTLDEEREKQTINSVEDIEETNEHKVTPKMIRFWGTGYKAETLQTLQGYYDELLKLCDGKPDVGKQKIMKNLCLLEYQQQQNIQNGKDIGTLSNSYKSMFEASGLKNNEADVSNDAYGVWLAAIEKYCPSDYYKDKKKYHDFFGIGEYIERFMFRPLKNLIFGTKEKEKEYWIEDDPDDINSRGNN